MPKASDPSLEDAGCSTRLSSHGAEYGWHHNGLSMPGTKLIEAWKILEVGLYYSDSFARL